MLSIRDLKKCALKAKKMCSTFIRSETENRVISSSDVHVVQPPMLPFARFAIVRHFNTIMVRSHVREKLRSLGKNSVDVAVVTAPNACDYVGGFHEKKIVYYCVDDFTEWPGLDQPLVQSMEGELIRKADTFIVTSQDLKAKFSLHGINARLMTHGVDLDFFCANVNGEHPSLQGILRPRVGYFGLIDERCDQQLILTLAQRMVNISFVITGDIVTDVSLLKGQKNIYFTGKVPYGELPHITQGLDVLILPYKVNKLTNAIQPLKLKEYLATGKPVISCAIREACNLSKFVSIVITPQEWEMAIRSGLEETFCKNKIDREMFLKNESWGCKAEFFFRLIED
jgi:glycosyltransferase involved in cell wall biosynthesis